MAPHVLWLGKIRHYIIQLAVETVTATLIGIRYPMLPAPCRVFLGKAASDAIRQGVISVREKGSEKIQFYVVCPFIRRIVISRHRFVSFEERDCLLTFSVLCHGRVRVVASLSAT